MPDSNPFGDPQAFADVPDDWVRHFDPWAGFALAYPRGWSLRTDRGAILVSENPGDTVVAWIASRPLAGAPSVHHYAAQYVEALRASDPTFEAVPIADPTPAPGKLLLRTRCRRGATVLDGRINMVVRGDQVVLRGFHVPAGNASAASPPGAEEMLKILNSFRSFPVAQRQAFREPREGAFTAVVPAGWNASGKVERNGWTGATTCEFTAQSDPRGLTKVCVPGSFFQFADSWFGKRFMPATQFAAEWLPAKLPVKGFAVEQSEEWRELLPLMWNEVAQLGMDPRGFEITTARTTGTFTFAGTRLRQRIFTATLRSARSGWMDPLAGQWFGLLPFYYHAPESEFDSVDRLLAGIGRSFHIDPNWRQRQAAAAAQQQALANMMFQQTMASNRQAQQNFMNAQHRIWANRQHVSDGIMQSWQYHNAVQDHAMQQWSNATLGITDVMNPDTGVVHTVQNDFDQYWATNDGTIVGGSWATQPDPSWHQLEPVKL
jgi:hypothetical protein